MYLVGITVDGNREIEEVGEGGVSVKYYTTVEGIFGVKADAEAHKAALDDGSAYKNLISQGDDDV